MHDLGDHNPQAKLNDSNYDLGIWATIIHSAIILK